MPSESSATDEPTTHMLGSIYRAAHNVDAVVSARLGPCRLSFARWQVLDELLHVPSLSIQQIADAAGVHRTSAASAVRTLEASVFVDVHEDCEDRRRVKISITDAGRVAHTIGRKMIADVDLREILSGLRLTLG